MDLRTAIIQHLLHRRRRQAVPWLLIAAALAGAGCSGRISTVRSPTKTEAIAQAREMFELHAEAILANPASAPRAIEPVVEMFEPLAAHHGPPFVEFLATVKEVRSSWGPKPSAAAVAEGVATLREALARLDEAQRR
jgi:predicted RNase H-like HicB family nuclease